MSHAETGTINTNSTSSEKVLFIPFDIGTICTMKSRQEQIEREARAERLKEARRMAGFGGVTSAAAQFGWNENNYKAHESGRNGFTVTDGRKYARAFKVSFHWLYLGEGSPTPSDKEEMIPLVSFISAGKLSEPNGHSEPESQTLFPRCNLPNGDWIALKVEGDSMDLYSPPGSIIFVNRLEKDVVDGGLYVVMTDDGDATYKKFRTNPDRLEPQSTNKDHETIFPRGPVNVVGRVHRTWLDFSN
ncbi:LexA family transcriptional regulator [Martelella alba]|uniref:LexA family transcriptional regulator n=1 Tax=Martelella alba TaxID=2590451 RepID=A0A506U9R9_9HYPH|nr:S24 family peptidase [Martelella alba]TPW29695.1 LexA family transcriptional regulator [Martelella alba]